ncbi:hypothetical protein NQ314_010044 [Rhamnusium bicolor]|uniref:Enoyl reductase (ER) domain-containing protein n=1 Tax=Rhamnusium bicolor TaxID=1586634 RepID=A0AAV8XTW0_9CUCU|nr:hypothetical protein NQ314_010044 [Rhamnusium bicolor]
MNKVFIRTARKLYESVVSNGNKRLASFRAAVIKETGKPLEIEERQIVSLKPGQVRIQVLYCSVNSVDCYKFKHGGGEFPFIPGYELSGEVIEKGKDVSNEQIIVGDRVAGLSLEHFGGLAEQCVLDVDDVWRIPSDLERKDAAVITYGHSTALYAFSKLATLKENARVIISAGPAGLGLAAVDVAANIYKAKERGELVRQRGAFETLHFTKNLTKQCMKITENKGVSVVYDAVGDYMMDTIGSCTKAPLFSDDMVSDTLQLASDGDISAHVSAKFNLKQINEAIQFIEDKKCTGKVLIHIDD